MFALRRGFRRRTPSTLNPLVSSGILNFPIALTVGRADRRIGKKHHWE